MSNETFTDLLSQRDELLNRKGILRECVDHLEKFLDTDAQKTEHGIRSDGTNIVVPQEFIEAERNGFVTQIEEIDKHLAELENRKVIDDEQKTKADGSSKKAKSKPGKSKNGKGGKGNGGKANTSNG